MPKRIQLQRKKGWRKPEGAIVVARPAAWGNPYKVGDTVEVDGRLVRVTQAIAVALFRIWVEQYADYARETLAGHDLACWCPLDQPCHADVLLEIANDGWEAMG